MCGFLGYTGVAHIDESVFREVLDMGRHRGPDRQDVFRAGSHLYGFNRLAIQDLTEHGNQPMVSPSGRQVLLFNGEVYNHMQLRERHRIDTCLGHGDTETLFQLFRKNGFMETIPELDGMFAICWADYDQGLLFLARDMAGIKPLYYHVGQSVVFASQLNQILKLPVGISQELSAPHVADYLSLGTMLAPETVFPSIRQVRPGEVVTIDLNNQSILSLRRYYIFSREPDAANYASTDKLAGLIDQSVSEQLVADVPVASFMSGGIDSPVINAFAKRSKPDIHALTFKNRYDPSLDESGTANALSDLIGLSYRNIDYTEDDMLQAVDEQFRFLTEPCGDFSTIPTFFICKAARNSSIVMLSGDGGDELFFGYNRHLSFFRDAGFMRLPKYLRAPVAALRRATGSARLSNSIRYHDDVGTAYRDAHMSLRPAEISKLMYSDGFSDTSAELFSIGSQAPSSDLGMMLTKADYYGYLQMVLRKVDMMSMASSVEVRVPYLSKDIIDFSRGYLPLNMHSEDGLKRPLKDIFKRCYPGGESFHRKIGFTLPITQLLRGPLKKDVLAFTCEKKIFGSGILNATGIQAFIRDYFEMKHTNSQGVWHLYAWQKWAYNNKLI